VGETKRQQQVMLRVMGSTRLSLGHYRDQLQAQVKGAKQRPQCHIYGEYVVTLADALEEAMRALGVAPESRVNTLLRRLRR
jgi:hypothetical protein